MKYIKRNEIYDPENNYTCNKLNFYLLKKMKKKSFVFIHVPVNSRYNNEIRGDLLNMIDYMRYLNSSGHKIQAITENVFTRGYTGIERAPCTRGIYFPFNENDTHEMTMKETPMDLDIIFLDKSQKIVKIFHARKFSSFYKYFAYSVLEMPYPYCINNFLKIGDKISIIT